MFARANSSSNHFSQFDSPTPDGHLYLGRNHPFVEELCRTVLAHSINRESGGAPARAARASVIKCKEVSIKTTLLLFRCRNVIERRDKSAQIVAEEMLLWGFRGSPSDKQFIDSREVNYWTTHLPHQIFHLLPVNSLFPMKLTVWKTFANSLILLQRSVAKDS